MKYTTIAAACIVLFFCALSAGCTSPTQAEINPSKLRSRQRSLHTTATVVETTTTRAVVIAAPRTCW